MKPATLKALKGSIAKWEKLVAGTGGDAGWDNCPLCKHFAYSVDNCERPDGERCPVFIASGYPQCVGTPWQDWSSAQYDLYGYVHPIRAHDDETVMCAVLELEFLKSLLP